MTSEIRANTLKNRVGLGTIEYSNTGPVISGVTTASNFKTGSSNLHSSGVEVAGINVLGADTPIGTGATIYNSGAAVFTGVVTATSFSGSGDLDVDGHTNLDNVSIAGVTTTGGLLDINAGGQANTFKVEDLTSGRVVLAGTGGELEDSGNLTFNGTTLAVTGAITASTSITATNNLITNGNFTISSTNPNIFLTDTNNDSDYRISNSNGVLEFRDVTNSVTRFQIASDGKVLMDNTTGTFTIGGDNVYDSAKINLMVGSSSQTSATTEATALVIHDQNSRRNGTEGAGSWKSKIVFRSTQINGNSASEGASIVHDITYNNYSSTKMRSDLVFKTRGDAQTSASDAATEKLRINHSGKVIIGASSVSPATSYTDNLVVSEATDNAGIQIVGNNSNSNYATIGLGDAGGNLRSYLEAQLGANGNFTIGTNGTGPIRFTNSSGEAVRIHGTRVIIGHTATDDRDGYNSSLQVSGTGGDDSSLTIGRWSDNQSSPALVFSKSRNGTIGNHTALSGNEYLGAIQFQGDDGSNYHVGASIQARVENFTGGVGSDDMPTRLIFNTNRDEANVAGRMIIHGRGTDYNVLYGGRVDINGYEGQNITGAANSNVLNEQFLVCPSAADGYDDSHTITFGQTKGNWEGGTSSAYDTSWGLMWHYAGQYNSTRELRAGIHYDHKGQERFKFWSSYGDIIFKTRSSSQGSRTAEDCDQEPLRITNTNRVGINRGGTASVDQTLDVDGTSMFRDRLYVGTTHIKGVPFGANVTYDTGISVNGSGYGGSMLALCSRNYGAGTGTQAALYFLHFYYDGNHQPAKHYLGGASDFVTFGKSASNTLTVLMGASNNYISMFGASI